MDQQYESVVQFYNSAQPEQPGLVVFILDAYDSHARLLVDATSDPEAVDTAINEAKVKGNTPTYLRGWPIAKAKEMLGILHSEALIGFDDELPDQHFWAIVVAAGGTSFFKVNPKA